MSAAERPSYAGFRSALGIEKGEDLGRRPTARATGSLVFAIVAILVDGGQCSPRYRAHQRGPNSLLHVVCDGPGTSRTEMLFSEGKWATTGAVSFTVDALLGTGELLADWGYDPDWVPIRRCPGIVAFSLSGANREVKIPDDKALCLHRHKIEHLFARLRD